MIRHFWLLFLLLIGSATTFAQERRERAFASNVSQARLLATVRDLVRVGPRAGGTKSGDQATAYVEAKFRRAGFKPEVVEDADVLASSNVRWTLNVVEPRALRKLIRNEWLGGFSPIVQRTRAALRYASDASDLEKGSLQGEAVLLDRFENGKMYQGLIDAGASCILLTSPRLENAYSQWAMITDLKQSADNPIPLFNLSYQNGQRLKEALADSQRVVIGFSTETKIASGNPKTVVATLAGDTSAYYIICAHGDSDSGGPGADDNASGVSGVLEIARNLMSLVRRGVVRKPTFTIRFIIWGKEMHSTENFVKRHANDLDKILGVINIDEIGTGVTRDCLYFESNEVRQNEKLLRTLEAVGEEYVGRKGFWRESTTNPSQGGTDSYVFFPEWLRYLKVPDARIPAVTIYTGAWNELKRLRQTEGWTSRAWTGHPDSVYIDFSSYYHSSLDIPETTTEKEPHNMVGAVKAVGIALLRLAW